MSKEMADKKEDIETVIDRREATSLMEPLLITESSRFRGVTPRHARRTVSALIERGVLTSKGIRDPLTLAFPAALAGRWMPGLFPEQTASS